MNSSNPEQYYQTWYLQWRCTDFHLSLKTDCSLPIKSSGYTHATVVPVANRLYYPSNAFKCITTCDIPSASPTPPSHWNFLGTTLSAIVYYAVSVTALAGTPKPWSELKQFVVHVLLYVVSSEIVSVSCVHEMRVQSIVTTLFYFFFHPTPQLLHHAGGGPPRVLHVLTKILCIALLAPRMKCFCFDSTL